MSCPLSVVVCTYNRAALLPVCLQSLANQTLSIEDYEVIVVDNASTDTTAEVIAGFVNRYSNFRGIREMSQGLSQARNCGWRNARGRFVAYLDDDARAEIHWCEVILEAIRRKPNVAALGGPILPLFEREPPPWFAPRLEVREWGKKAKLLPPPVAHFGFSGSNMVIRRDILDEFGGFATHLGMSGETLGLGEETELFTRVYPHYPRFWYEPKMRVFHWTPASKFKPKYRLLRAFHAGKTQARVSATRESAERFFLRKLITAPYRFGHNTVKRLELGDRPFLMGLLAAEEVARRLGLLAHAFAQTTLGRTLIKL